MVKISSARIDVQSGRVDNALFKSYGEVVVGGATGTSASGAYTVDLSLGDVFNLVLDTATCQLFFTNPTAGGTTSCSFTLMLRQAIGSATVSWPSNIVWDNGTIPAVTTTQGRMDIFYFVTHDAGRKWFGFAAQQNITSLNASNTKLWGWGINASAPLGTNDNLFRLSPAPLSENAYLYIGVAGAGATALTDTSNRLWTIGLNNPPLVGDTSLTTRSSPTQVGTLTDWGQVTGSNHTFHALKTDGTLWGWGANVTGGSVGSVGNNTATTQFTSPVQIGTLTNWVKVGGSAYVRLATDTSGRLWGWGTNTGSGGTVGDNVLVSRSSPVQIGTLTNWATPSTGFGAHIGCVKTDGTLWMWGIGSGGTIGDNAAASRSSPVQVGSLTNWATVSVGTNFTVATKTDGTLWSWGTGTFGQLANNAGIITSSPVQVGTLTNWSKVGCGSSHAVALKTDGTIWSWGYNGGRLGLGSDTVTRSSPVQVGIVTAWTKLEVGGSHTIIYKP